MQFPLFVFLLNIFGETIDCQFQPSVEIKFIYTEEKNKRRVGLYI